MTRFRPCIDLHHGLVKQIVGGTLRDDGAGPRENFVSDKPPAWFAQTFRNDQLTGGHVIKLGPGNRFRFNYDYCKGCGLCAEECPCGAIEMVDDKAKVDPDTCTECGACVDTCPVSAIRME